MNNLVSYLKQQLPESLRLLEQMVSMETPSFDKPLVEIFAEAEPAPPPEPDPSDHREDLSDPALFPVKVETEAPAKEKAAAPAKKRARG